MPEIIKYIITLILISIVTRSVCKHPSTVLKYEIKLENLGDSC
jgi:hypothetical protein